MAEYPNIVLLLAFATFQVMLTQGCHVYPAPCCCFYNSQQIPNVRQESCWRQQNLFCQRLAPFCWQLVPCCSQNTQAPPTTTTEPAPPPTTTPKPYCVGCQTHPSTCSSHQGSFCQWMVPCCFQLLPCCCHRATEAPPTTPAPTIQKPYEFSPILYNSISPYKWKKWCR